VRREFFFLSDLKKKRFHIKLVVSNSPEHRRSSPRFRSRALGGGKLDETMFLEKINERCERRNVQFSGRKLYSLAVQVLRFVKSVFFEGVRDVLSVGFAENIREEAPCIVL
jgi:hypothetical protein